MNADVALLENYRAKPARISSGRKRLLRLLADVVDGTNEAMLEAHGFKPACIAAAESEGQVRVTMRHYEPPGLRHKYPNGFDVRRLFITDVGRAALARDSRKRVA
jgi:hypothetical protein